MYHPTVRLCSFTWGTVVHIGSVAYVCKRYALYVQCRCATNTKGCVRQQLWRAALLPIGRAALWIEARALTLLLRACWLAAGTCAACFEEPGAICRAAKVGEGRHMVAVWHGEDQRRRLHWFAPSLTPAYLDSVG